MVLLVNDGTLVKIGPPPKNGGSKRPFSEQNFTLCHLWASTAWKRGETLGKLKQQI